MIESILIGVAISAVFLAIFCVESYTVGRLPESTFPGVIGYVIFMGLIAAAAIWGVVS